MKKMTQKLFFLFLLLVVSLGYSQKVAVIGMNHTGTDGFTFVATQDLSAGEVIYFTENEYNDATNAFVDASEGVVIFTAGSTILKGNVVFVNETTTNTFTVTCTGGGSCGTAVISGAGPFALATGGEGFYAYTDSDANPINGVTTIYSVLYTGFFEGASTISGGDIIASQNPVFDFPNAIVIDGFPAVNPDRTEFIPTALARTDVSKVTLENPSNYVHAQTNAALSTIFFTNLNLVASNPVVTVTASPASVNENSGTGMVYTFSLSATATSNLTINFSVGGLATFGSDYSQTGAASFSASAGTVTIPNGSNTASITLNPTGDSTLEANETIQLTLTAGSGYVAGSPGAATTTINNDDTLTITPIVAVTGVNHSTTADGFSFVALQDITAGTTVYFTENPFDRTTLTFSGAEGVMQWTAPAGGLARGQVVVATETAANVFTTTCSSGSCGSVSLVSGTFTLATSGEELYAYLDSDSNHTNGVTSVQAVLFTGTSVTSGGVIPSVQDPSLVYTGAVVVDGFPATAPLRTEYNPALRGTTVDRANFQNPANWINGGSNITLSTVPFANIIISTGVANPFASVTVSPSNVIENSGTPMVYTFALSSPATSNITINFSVSGTATFTTDYTASGASSFTSTTGSVVIPNGSSSATIQVTPVGDTALEVQESVVLTITTGTGYDGGSPNAATGLINNDDTTDSDPLVALVGMSHVDPDGFSFVAAQDIPANTVVYFTDNSFNNSTLLFGSGEGVIRWTSPGTVITKGNVVVVTETAPDTFTVTCSNGTCGSVTLISGNLAIATTGETLYAYEDNDTNPSNGVTDIYAVLFTGTSSVSGGNIPAIEDPSNIFLKALVVDGFPAVAPARTEYDPTKRNVAVSAVNFEDVSNWIHAQSPPALSTVPFANLNIVDNVPPTAICQNISVTPNIGTGSVTITASQIDNGSTDNAGILSLSVSPTTFTCANVGTPVTVTLTVTDTSGNTATCNATVTVLPNVTATFTQVAPICSGEAFTLPTTSNNGFVGTWSPAINNAATTTYTFTPNAGQCGGPTTMTVVVNPSTTPTFDPVAPICAGATLAALPTTSLNGITGTWSPALNNAATTTYTFTPNAGQCASTTTLTITVNSTPSPITPNLNVTYTGQCGFLSGLYIYEGLLNGKASFHLSSDTTLRISFDGTKWVLWCCSTISSTGFENTNVPAGLYPPTTGWTPTQCSSGTMTISSDSNFEVCIGSTLADISVVGTNIQWYDAATNGNLLSSSTVLTTGIYYVTQTISGCESTPEAVNVTVNPLTTPTFDPVAAICVGDALTALPTTSLNGIIGTWSPALDNTVTTTYTFTPNLGQCSATTTLTITVNPLVTPTFDPFAPICSGATIAALPTTSLNGITGTWSPAINNTATTTYTFTPNPGQCAGTAVLTITINIPVGNTLATAIDVVGLNYTTTGNNLASNCYTDTIGSPSPDVWYKVNLEPCVATISLNTCSGTNYDSRLRVYAPDGITELANNDDFCGLQSGIVNLNVASYSFVYVIVEGYTSNQGNYGLSITQNVVNTATFPPVAPFCSGSTPAPLPTTSNEGVTGVWTPALDTTQTTTYTFTPTNTCVLPVTLTIPVTLPQGNPSVFGNNEWNVYAWNSGGNNSSDNPWVNNYSGFYTATGVNFNTQNQWNDSPSDAPGYQGCPVAVDYHSWSAKRQGFPTNYYSLNVDGHDDSAELYINGTLVWDHQGCCDSHSGVWQGILGPTDQVEFRATEGVGGTYGILSFAILAPTISTSGATTFCDGGSVTLTSSPTVGTGYLWSNGATTQSITVNTTGNYSVQFTGTLTSDPSSVVNVVVNPNPVVTVSGNSSICEGSSVTLTASGADNIAWNISTTTIPLDVVSGAQLAVGLRKLKSSYAGPCVRLRRDSDNTESDFGFTGNDIDTTSISSWLNGATGYCVTLYDQSGNGGDVIQNSASNQPSLVLNGYAGKPVLHFNTVQFMYNAVNYTSAFTAIYGARQTGGSRGRVLSALNNNWLLGYWNGAKRQAYYEGWVSSNPGSPAADDIFYVYTGASDGSVSQLYENGSLIENNNGGVTGPFGIELNGWQGGFEMSDVDISEVFMFSSVLASVDRNFVENSTNGYYGVLSSPSITVTPTATTTYTVIGTNTTGCSATTSFTVTVNPVSTNTTTITATNIYTWAVNGQTYTTSGTYTFVNGCATEILNLTIIPGTGGTSIIPSQCGVTLDAYNRIVYASPVAGADRYRFRVTNLGTNQIAVVENPLRHLFLRNLSIYEYDQAYAVEVAARVGGVWSNFGPSCTVTTPVVTTQVRASQCGATLASKIDIVYADNVSGVLGYRFKVTNLTTNSVQIIDRATRAFQFNAVTDYSDATNYSIEVALLNTDNTYLPYGTACIVTTSVTTGKLAAISFDVVGYPNPFNTAFKLDVKSSSTSAINVRVYDMIGKLIEERQVNANEIDVFEVGSNYAQGVYNVIVSQDDAIQTIRMVKR